MRATRTGGASAPSAHVTVTCPLCKRRGLVTRETIRESATRRVLVIGQCGHYIDLLDGAASRSELDS